MGLIKDTLYFKFIQERVGADIIENENSFITYLAKPPEIFMMDVYVAPESRGTSTLRNMILEFEQIGRAKGCEFATANIDTKLEGHEHTLSSALKLGYSIKDAERKILFIAKHLNGGQ